MPQMASTAGRFISTSVMNELRTYATGQPLSVACSHVFAAAVSSTRRRRHRSLVRSLSVCPSVSHAVPTPPETASFVAVVTKGAFTSLISSHLNRTGYAIGWEELPRNDLYLCRD